MPLPAPRPTSTAIVTGSSSALWGEQAKALARDGHAVFYDSPAATAEAGIKSLEDDRRIVVLGVESRVGTPLGAHPPRGPLPEVMDRSDPVGK